MRVRKLRLDAHLDRIEGCADELRFFVRGSRTNKAGASEYYELEFKTSRCAVRTILTQLHEMHERDRTRLTREGERIDREIRALTQG